MESMAYRAKAAELRKEATRATRADVKEQLLLMAADWDKLANAAEDAERRGEGVGGAGAAPKGASPSR